MAVTRGPTFEATTFLTSADLSSSQYLIVKGDGSGGLELAAAASDEPIGIVDEGNDGSSTATQVSVRTMGGFKVKLGGSVALGDRLTSNASGQAVASTDPEDKAVGIALDDGDSGDVIPLLITPGALGSAGESAINIETGTIAAGSVATLNATPVTVIAAPGAGKYIEIVSVEWFLDYGSVQYDAVGANDDLELRYTDGSGALLATTDNPTGFGDASADAYLLARGADQHVVTLNAPVVARIATGEWYSAAGDSPLKYAIHYRVRTAQT